MILFYLHIYPLLAIILSRNCRLFSVGDRTYLSYHSWLVDPTYKDQMSGRLFMYDLDRHIKKKITLNSQLHRTEINWIPLDVNGQLYFTYSLDPLRVMKCNRSTAACEYVFEQKGTTRNPFIYSSDHLRGGSPWILYKYPYYISVGHNVVVTKSPDINYSLYNANIIVMSVEPWKIVYVSKNIEFDSRWLNNTKVVRNHTILRSFFYPSGAILKNNDVLDVSGHVNDAAGHIIRIRGIQKLMDKVIYDDNSNGYKSASLVRSVQQYVLEGSKAMYKNWKFFGDIVTGTVEAKPNPASL